MDRVLVAMDQGVGEKAIPVFGLSREGAQLVVAYSGTVAPVPEGADRLTTPSDLVLLSTPSRNPGPAGP